MKRLLTAILTYSISTCILTSCEKSSETSNKTDTAPETESVTEAAEDEPKEEIENTTENAESEIADETKPSQETDLSNVNYDDVAASVEFGDFSGIETLTDDILAGKYDGKVIVIDGINFKAMTHASIMETGEGGVKKGITYKLDGVKNIDDYPKDDAHIKITGVIDVDNDWGTRYLLVSQDKLEIMEYY